GHLFENYLFQWLQRKIVIVSRRGIARSGKPVRAQYVWCADQNCGDILFGRRHMAASPTGRISETSEISSGNWIPEAETERAAVREQLSRLLSSPIFINSRRCASLLRFVVDCALEGKADHLKERTLGIDVFQRDPHYDTNHDPVVRTTA